MAVLRPLGLPPPLRVIAPTVVMVALAAGCATPSGSAPGTVTAALESPASSRALARPEPDQAARFARWRQSLAIESRAAGITPETIAAVLPHMRLTPEVLDLDRRQPEFTRTLGAYLASAVSDRRVQDGRLRLAQNRTLLTRLEQAHGVPAPILVAFWGLESDFGRVLGSHRVIDSLATLAFDSRRSDFFRAQLLDALRLMDQEPWLSADALVGSWAGAMGQTQFMPSTFLAHAVDGDGDGRRDPWASAADALASGAAYVHALGWRAGDPWGWEVTLPASLSLATTGLDADQPLAAWAAQGVQRADGTALPVERLGQAPASVLLPAGQEGPAFLVLPNFHVILGWNRSILYALAVGHLADRIAGAGPLIRPPPAGDRPLRTAEVVEIQSRLNQLGYAAGPVDGLAGRQTRDAVRRFQTATGQPADGYADAGLLQALRAAGGGEAAASAED